MGEGKYKEVSFPPVEMNIKKIVQQRKERKEMRRREALETLGQIACVFGGPYERFDEDCPAHKAYEAAQKERNEKLKQML